MVTTKQKITKEKRTEIVERKERYMSEIKRCLSTIQEDIEIIEHFERLLKK